MRAQARRSAEWVDRSIESQLADRYVLEGVVGEGGMGTVFRARAASSNAEDGSRRFAIKVLKEHRAELVTRLVREACIAKGLSHPNLVSVHEVLQLEDGSPVIVMELLRGESLGERLDRDKRLSVLDLVPIVVAAVDALVYAHARGVVHRDLKPDNIFLSEAGGPIKVLDFGIAKVVADADEPPVTAATLTRTGQILGTPQYMSPEQIFGEKDIDARADIWALGATLYEALSGRRPFEGDNMGQIFKAVALDPLVPLEVHAPWVPRDVRAVIGRMLTHSRAERLSDLSEVRAAFVRAATGTEDSHAIGFAPTVAADPVEPTPKLRPATALARRRAPVVWVAALTLLVGASIPVALMKTSPVAVAPLAGPLAAPAPPAEQSAAATVMAPAFVEAIDLTTPAPAPPIEIVAPIPAVPGVAARVAPRRGYKPVAATPTSSAAAESAPSRASNHRSGSLDRNEF